MNLRDHLSRPENLNYAWRKARKLSLMYDGYLDFAELAEFEINLADNLESIRSKLANATYRTKPVRPLPRPKKATSIGTTDRQYYHVAISDQVAWIAIANAFGALIDKSMPAWSYGNRLYRPAWYERIEGKKSELEIGPYRHASGHLYRKFKHSWPLFRRHVNITAKIMSSGKRPINSDEADELALITGHKNNLIYFSEDFWPAKPDGDTLYYASIDLARFYPKVRTSGILKSLVSEIPGLADDDGLVRMIRGMLKFNLDNFALPQAVVSNVEPPFPARATQGIPTGLFVGGFLANVAMLPADRAVEEQVIAKKNIAHFRFVDDHAILAYSLDDLCDWIEWYKELLVSLNIGPKINDDKFDPPSLKRWLVTRKKTLSTDKQKAARQRAQDVVAADTAIAGSKPTKLMTKTLALVSDIGATNFDTLDDSDIENLLVNLEWLLLADLPEREIRADTRAAFAAGQITKVAALLSEDTDEIVTLDRSISASRAERVDPNDDKAVNLKDEKVRELSNQLQILRTAHEKSQARTLAHRFDLLLGAFKEHPSKARLFIRLVEFCRITGHDGLSAIREWISDLRNSGRSVWADYYAGQSLQLIALSMLSCAAKSSRHASLHSELESSAEFMDHVTKIDVEALFGGSEDIAWFHRDAVELFCETLELCGAQLSTIEPLRELAQKLTASAKSASTWLQSLELEKGTRGATKSASIWAHIAEERFQTYTGPSSAWQFAKTKFNAASKTDLKSLRRYPHHLAKNDWQALIDNFEFKEPDAGWLREAIGGSDQRFKDCTQKSGLAYRRATANINVALDGYIDLTAWIEFLQTKCDAFDPRAGEWTALEIIAQILEQVLSIEGSWDLLKRLHPRNVFIPAAWTTLPENAGSLSWEDWRKLMQGLPRVLEGASTLTDYRYRANDSLWNAGVNWDGKLHSIGRLLLELLSHDFAAPPIWNIPGNEVAQPLPVTSIIERVAISSRTQEILESALGLRASETRDIPHNHDSFGWEKAEKPNDTEFDPGPLSDPQELLDAVRRAQLGLLENQISVSRNQPRQLIPVILKTGSYNATEADQDTPGDEIE